MVMFEATCPVCGKLMYLENRKEWAFKVYHKYYCSYKCFRIDAEKEKQRQREQRERRRVLDNQRRQRAREAEKNG